MTAIFVVIVGVLVLTIVVLMYELSQNTFQMNVQQPPQQPMNMGHVGGGLGDGDWPGGCVLLLAIIGTAIVFAGIAYLCGLL